MPHYLTFPSQLANVTVIQTITHTPSNNDTPYGDFNLGLHVFDEPAQVLKNRMQLLVDLQQISPHLSKIHWLNQIHGNHVATIHTPMTACECNADAQITSQKNTALAIMTADCVPIMIADDSGTMIGAVHAGWQGLAKNIIAETVQKMQKKPDTNFFAWIGACIGKANYEVDDKVKNAVLATLNVSDAQKNELFTPTTAGHYLADLAKVAELQLNACGVKQVYQSQLDSYTDDRFYSYRKQTQKKQVATGRMATLIFIHD